ncbi:hypothetical protein [Staphylococcus warneri]|uniref:hypothetical protein n=1 Tax=Staphylococcus warneri TaxID=1292 RepID=UPI002928085A|nr:hypothetical protein [Staphylococcus warneri]MDU9352034.1 hypothetical protein [Staphylococcus warneri]
MKKTIVAAITCSLLLAGCSNERNDEVKTKEPVEFGNALSKGEHFLFSYDSHLKGVEKDDKIKQISYIKDGKITTYNFEKGNLTLNKASDKGNEDLLKWAKKYDKKSFDDELSERKETTKTLSEADSDTFSKKERKEYKDTYDKLKKIKYIEPKANDLKITRSTDDDDRTKQISLKKRYESIDLHEGNKKEYEKSVNETLSDFYEESIPTKKINGQKYSGLQLSSGDSKQDATYNKVVMKIDKDQSKVVLDRSNSKYVKGQ